jgi:hypothetical protein
LDDKTVLASLNKESIGKLNNCHKNLKELIFKQSKSNYSDYFETILSELQVETSSSNKQNEV